MKKKILVALAYGSTMILAACNTVDGAVEDVESVGDCVDGVEGNC